MYTYELIIAAKSGSKNAVDILIDRYFDHFCNLVYARCDINELHNTVIKTYKIKNATKEVLDLYTKYYLKKEFEGIMKNFIVYYEDDNLSSYLNKKVRGMFKPKINEYKNEKTNTENKIRHYTNIYYNLLKNKITFFTDEEIIYYCKSFVMMVFKRPSGLASITNEIKNDDLRIKDDYTFILRYVKVIGTNDKILEYLNKKFYYILQDIETKYGLKIENEDFKNIINNVLKNATQVNVNLEKLIKAELKKKVKKSKKKIIVISDLNENLLTQDEIEKVREDNHYLVIKAYNNTIKKCKALEDDEDFIKKLDEKYNDLFDYIIKSDKDFNIKKYIATRLLDFCNRKIDAKNKSIVDNNKLMSLYLDNYDIYYSKLESLLNNDNCYLTDEKKERLLNECYINSIKKYMKSHSNKSIDSYLKSCLYRACCDTENKYNVDYFNEVKKYFDIVREKNNISKEAYDSFIYGYLNGIRKEEDLQLYLFNQIRYFDKDEFEYIKSIKKKLV